MFILSFSPTRYIDNFKTGYQVTLNDYIKRDMIFTYIIYRSVRSEQMIIESLLFIDSYCLKLNIDLWL